MPKKQAIETVENQPSQCAVQARIVGLEVRPGYCRAGLRLDRTWHAFTVTQDQLALLSADPRVQVKPQE